MRVNRIFGIEVQLYSANPVCCFMYGWFEF